jgi:hypothetical protein
MLSLQILAASCDLIAAGLGVCGCASSATSELDYQLCAVQKVESEQTVSQDRPRRWCKYYSNGTIDVATPIFIEAYVYVGSRLCIGDQPQTQGVSIDDELRGQLRARSGTALATWSPGGELEIDEIATFDVSFASKTVSGTLLDRSATIRFTAVSHRWVFSDGDRATGQRVEKSFYDPANQSAQGYVRVRVDYRFADGSWVVGAMEGEIASNRLELRVIERPRKTLLVG